MGEPVGFIGGHRVETDTLAFHANGSEGFTELVDSLSAEICPPQRSAVVVVATEHEDTARPLFQGIQDDLIPDQPRAGNVDQKDVGR